ncbi:MAG TPA: DUF2723 domain-containing protein, partial [Acidimicrobiales bacterium]|nr:DUF2723 domain-containing protein [Acidimicrobiales bacterium]
AAAVMVDLVRALTRSLPLAIAAGIGLALTEIVWKIGTHAEAHALHLALLAILVRLLVAWEDRPAGAGDRLLIAATVVFGLSMGNHSLTLLLAPGVGLFVLAVDPGLLRRPRRMLGPIVALLVTLVLVYAQLPLRAGPFRADLVYGRPDTWEGFWAVVLAEQFRGSVSSPFSDLTGKIRELAELAVGWWGPLAALIPVGFLAVVMRRPRYALLSGLSVLITCFFAASYANADIGRYYLGPVLFAWTWLAMLAATILEAIGVGADDALDQDETLDDASAIDAAGTDPAPGAAPPGTPDPIADVRPDGPRLALDGRLAALGLSVLMAAFLLVPTAFEAPARFERVDRSTDTSARRWLDRVLTAM